MRFNIPQLSTPENQPGLEHISTTLKISKSKTFEENNIIYEQTNTGEEKNAFDVSYYLDKNEVLYLQYYVGFLDGSRSPDSQILMVSGNRTLGKNKLENSTVIPATPKISLKNNLNITALDDVLVETDDVYFFSGIGEIESTSWFLYDNNENIIWEKKKDTVNKLSIKIPKNKFNLDKVYTIGCIRHFKNLSVSSLEGKTRFKVTNNMLLRDEDHMIKVMYDEFKLYGASQSILKFKQMFHKFLYLSIKIYDYNGILVRSEIKAETSPVNINTSMLEIGKKYTIWTSAYFINDLGEVDNTTIEIKSFYAERYTASLTLSNMEYDDFSGLYWDPVYVNLKGFNDSSVFFTKTERLNTGETALLMTNGYIVLGHWTNDGFINSGNKIDCTFFRNLPRDVNSNNKQLYFKQFSNSLCILLSEDYATNEIRIHSFYLNSAYEVIEYKNTTTGSINLLNNDNAVIELPNNNFIINFADGSTYKYNHDNGVLTYTDDIVSLFTRIEYGSKILTLDVNNYRYNVSDKNDLPITTEWNYLPLYIQEYLSSFTYRGNAIFNSIKIDENTALLDYSHPFIDLIDEDTGGVFTFDIKDQGIKREFLFTISLIDDVVLFSDKLTTLKSRDSLWFTNYYIVGNNLFTKGKDSKQFYKLKRKENQ